jgi:1-acyl-sn-glycerol-3-phosphate acyltransferase
MDTHVPN